MAWTDYFVSNIAGAKVVVSEQGKPFVSHEIAPRDYVEIELTETSFELPFKISFRSFNSLGEQTEHRMYAQAGTKDMARKFATEVANLRLNSREFVLDGE
ncbi:MAG: hypothetical protein EBU08_12140 [Micrococcales bacterium]|nr:hypothetical protein [Micrococcales bacterium]